MNADQLDTQWRRYTGVPPATVDLLVEHGYLDTVVDAARQGEWFCARRAVREFAALGEHDEAWQLIAPYVATGWWGAIRAAAGLLDGQGRDEEALALVRGYSGPDERLAWGETARRLAELGRAEEAITLLRPHLQDWLLLRALAESTAGHGLDAEVIALLEPLANQKLRTGDPSNAARMLARVLERAGRTDDAVDLLRLHLDANKEFVFHNDVEELALLYARHNRFDELYALATTARYADPATPPLVNRLVELDRADEAVAFLRSAVLRDASCAGSRLVSLLGKLGRLDEAMEAAGPVLTQSACACLLGELLEYLVRAGRGEQALEVLDSATADNGTVAEDMGDAWSRLLSEAGRHEDAVSAARARGEDEYGRDRGIAAALEAAGRIDEALAVLEDANSVDGGSRTELARLLVLAGRPQDAVAVHRAPIPKTEEVGNGGVWGSQAAGYSDGPRF